MTATVVDELFYGVPWSSTERTNRVDDCKQPKVMLHPSDKYAFQFDVVARTT